MIIWIIGLAGSGKTTLSKELYEKKIKRVKNKNDYKKSNILKYILKNYKVIIHDLSNIITNKQF